MGCAVFTVVVLKETNKNPKKARALGVTFIKNIFTIFPPKRIPILSSSWKFVFDFEAFPDPSQTGDLSAKS